MTQTPAITVTGASGRMGQMLITAITAHPAARLIGCIERPGHAWIGQDIGLCMGGAALGVLVTDDPLEAFAQSQAVIDFTAPAATVEFAALAAQARAVHVIGTTGLEPAHHAKLDAAAHHAVIIQAGNMSLGVNLLTRLTHKVAAALDADWDIEIIEAHHNRKVDAPSGTALMLGEAAAAGRGIALQTTPTQVATASPGHVVPAPSVFPPSAAATLSANMMCFSPVQASVSCCAISPPIAPSSPVVR